MTDKPVFRSDPRKILIIKPSSLGDVIHGLPVLHAVAARFPQSEIHWVVARGFHQVLENHPLIHKLWIIDKNSWKKPLKACGTVTEIRKLAFDLKREKFDLVIDLQGLFRSAMIGLFTGAEDRVGFDAAREGAKYSYTHRVKTAVEIHAVEKNMRIAEFLGCPPGEPRFPFPPLEVPPELTGLLPDEYAVIAPSAGTRVKRWPVVHFGYLASRLPVRSVIVAAGSDRDIADEISALSNGRAVSLAGKTGLRELAAIIRGAKFLVCPDTGPMHIAAALGVPVFAVFGPTSPVRTGPYGKIHTVIRSDLACSPCFRRKPCREWKCMIGISPVRVLAAIQDRLG